MTYRLRTLILLVTVVCVLVFLLTAAPGPLATYGLVLYGILITSFFLAGAQYAGENFKAFCRGALLPSFVFFAWLIWVFVQALLQQNPTNFSALRQFGNDAAPITRHWSIGTTVLSLLMGLATLGFKQLVAPRPPNPPVE